MNIGLNALSKFLDTVIVCQAKIVAIRLTNRAIKRLGAHQQKENDNALRCYIWCHEFVESEANTPKIYKNDHITGLFFGAANRQCNLKRLASFKIKVFFYNFRGYDAQLIVHQFGKRSDCEIKVIGQNIEKYYQVG